MKFHPFAETFSLIEGDDFDALVEDIKSHGLREKIWCYKGKVLDGRNRFLACKKAGVEATTRVFKGTDSEALAFVWSVNDRRRHLTPSQRAMAASRYKEHFKSLNLDSGDITQIAADHSKVSRASVFHADKVREEGSKALQKAVDSGEIPVSKAAKVVALPKSEQLKAATAKPEKPQEAAEPDMMPEPEALSADEMAEMDEAADKARQEFADKVMDSDDRLAAAGAEVERLTRDLANMTRHRDHWMNQAGANARFAKLQQRRVTKLTKDLEKSQAEIENLTERVSIMEAA